MKSLIKIKEWLKSNYVTVIALLLFVLVVIVLERKSGPVQLKPQKNYERVVDSLKKKIREDSVEAVMQSARADSALQLADREVERRDSVVKNFKVMGTVLREMNADESVKQFNKYLDGTDSTSR
jgi:predicted negative regulator of RcsB-dependent stress response